MATTTRRPRVASPERWQRAAERALVEGIQVRQLAGSGAWIATSGSNSSAAYELEVTGEVVHGCNCLAGLNGDPVCKHRAAFYLAVGLLDPEPEPPAPVLAACGYCSGRGWETVIGKSGTAYRFACQVCDGAGTVTVGNENEPSSPAAAAVPVVAHLAPPVCGRCQGTGTLTMAVAGGCAVYPTPVACHACHRASQVAAPRAA